MTRSLFRQLARQRDRGVAAPRTPEQSCRRPAVEHPRPSRRLLGLVHAPVVYGVLVTILLVGCTASGDRASTGNTSAGDVLSHLLGAKSSSAVATTVPAPAVHPLRSSRPTPEARPIVPTDFSAGHLAVTGQDSQMSKPLSLKDGLAIFHVTYNGNGDFSVILRDENGDVVADLANGHGSFDGSTAVGLADPCNCVLDVQTTGGWSITVDQPTALTGQSLPTTIRGNGQAASAAFHSVGGLTRFHQLLQGHTGGQVTLLTADGEELDVLGEGDVAFDRSRTVELDPGTYLLQVDTDGPWTVDITAVSGSQ